MGNVAGHITGEGRFSHQQGAHEQARDSRGILQRLAAAGQLGPKGLEGALDVFHGGQRRAGLVVVGVALDGGAYMDKSVALLGKLSEKGLHP